jgi:RHS repeat-associated protein
MIKRPFPYISMLLFLVAADIAPVNAQSNKPTSQTQVPAPTQVVAATPAAYSLTGMPINYVRTWEAMGPHTDAATFTAQSHTKVKQATQYVDGLGRPIQTVVKQITPGANPKDMVSPVIYDEFGRETYKYLPYVSTEANGDFKTNPFTEQQTFLQNQHPGEQVFYGKTDFEASPLNRPLKSYAPGNSWAGSGRGTEQKYLINTTADAVRIWDIGYNSNFSLNIPTASTNYAAGELYKNVVIDEAGNAVVEYKDKEGKVILKKVQAGNSVTADYTGFTNFLSTYYVYDDLGNLRFVIPPLAVKNINGGAVSATIADGLCFRYEYDGNNRMIAKKVPGAGWVYMIYDVRDRLVFTQDANMRNKPQPQWMATLYDALNRPVLTGIITYSGSRADLQAYVTATTGSNNSGEVIVTGSAPLAIESERTVNTQQTNAQLYQATNQIVWEAGFATEGNTTLVAEIVPSTASPVNETVNINNNPLPANSNFIALTVTYYDNYNFINSTNAPFAYSTAYNIELDAGNNLHPVALPTIAQQQQVQTKGMVTGARVRTLPNPDDLAEGKWLTTASFYDEKGRVIQVQSKNHKGGIDVTTNLYNFTGNILTSHTVHNNPLNPAVAQQALRIKTNMEYDHAGRLLKIFKTINNNMANKKCISTNDYDVLGQLKKKELGKNAANTAPIETLNYAYNIRGWLKGINQDYANGIGGPTSSKFGMELNYDWGFNNNQYNGNISGTKWRSAGDGEKRAYGFGYDNANRLLYGDFSQHSGSTYADDATINFDMKMGDGVNPNTAYDENGNIKGITQNGLLINNSTVIDNLQYTYLANSNQLQNVIDQNNQSSTKLGDFRSSQKYMTALGGTKTNAAIDYSYDDNGNLKKDLNKDIGTDNTDGIIYNHLNLPYSIAVKKTDGTEKGTIKYLYDAAGNKLEKYVYEGVTTTQPPTKTTSYLGSFIYENDVLQFISHEEGRIRITDIAIFPYPCMPPQPGQIAICPPPLIQLIWVCDYMIKDHLGNVRMVLTDEVKVDKYPVASLEDAKRTSIEKNYYDIQEANVVSKTAATGIPDYTNDNGIGNNPDDYQFSNANSNKLYKLNSNTAKTGLGITLKVMAGDKIDVFGKSYYIANNPGPGSNNLIPVLNLLNGFLNAPGASVITTTHGAVTNTTLNTAAGTAGITSMVNQQNAQSGAAPNKPRAFINVIFFDEQFKATEFKISMVGTASQLKDHFADLQNSTVPKNGYVYIYCSNETPIDVFFDNMQVVHTRGEILEETHYYPFGLVMSGISSQAAGTLKNKENTFQDQRFDDDLGLNWVQFKWRNHDPQIGRFIEIDPLSEKYVYNSTYAFSENKVTGHRELEGLEAWSVNPVTLADGSTVMSATVSNVNAPFSVTQGGVTTGFFPNADMNRQLGGAIVSQGSLLVPTNANGDYNSYSGEGISNFNYMTSNMAATPTQTTNVITNGAPVVINGNRNAGDPIATTPTTTVTTPAITSATAPSVNLTYSDQGIRNTFTVTNNSTGANVGAPVSGNGSVTNPATGFVSGGTMSVTTTNPITTSNANRRSDGYNFTLTVTPTVSTPTTTPTPAATSNQLRIVQGQSRSLLNNVALPNN